MASQDLRVEYIVTETEYAKAYQNLPEHGTDNGKATSMPIIARQYRQNTSQTINAGKWVMWDIAPETFDFTWIDGRWQPPANLVVLGDTSR